MGSKRALLRAAFGVPQVRRVNPGVRTAKYPDGGHDEKDAAAHYVGHHHALGGVFLKKNASADSAGSIVASCISMMVGPPPADWCRINSLASAAKEVRVDGKRDSRRGLILVAIVAVGWVTFAGYQRVQRGRREAAAKRELAARLASSAERVKMIGAYVKSLFAIETPASGGRPVPFLKQKPSVAEIEASIGPPDYSGEVSGFPSPQVYHVYLAWDFSNPDKQHIIGDAFVATPSGRMYGETEKLPIGDEKCRALRNAKVIYTFKFNRDPYSGSLSLDGIWVSVGEDKGCYIGYGFRNCSFDP